MSYQTVKGDVVWVLGVIIVTRKEVKYVIESEYRREGSEPHFSQYSFEENTLEIFSF